MNKVLCQGCKIFKDRDGMKKVGLGYICDDACMERVKERARAKHKRREVHKVKAKSPSGEQRKRVRRRDGESCRWCGVSRDLQVHHVLYLSQGGPNSMGNLVTLCQKHHEKAHSNKRVWQPVLLELLRISVEEGLHLTVPEVQVRMKAPPEWLG